MGLRWQMLAAIVLGAGCGPDRVEVPVEQRNCELDGPVRLLPEVPQWGRTWITDEGWVVVHADAEDAPAR